MNTLPVFHSVFLYGRWSKDPESAELLEHIQKISLCSGPAHYGPCDHDIPDEEDRPNGFTITASEKEEDCEKKHLKDIMYLVDRIRKYLPDQGMQSTNIEAFHWSGNHAFIELSCL
jgi:hypothetical protein